GPTVGAQRHQDVPRSDLVLIAVGFVLGDSHAGKSADQTARGGPEAGPTEDGSENTARYDRAEARNKESGTSRNQAADACAGHGAAGDAGARLRLNRLDLTG